MDKERKEAFVRWINSSSGQYALRPNEHGYYSVHPMPSEEDLEKFYSRQYFKDTATVAAKGMDVGDTDPLERFHHERQYAEITTFVDTHFKSRDIAVLDVGCGTGELLNYLKKNRFTDLHGTEFDRSLTLPDVRLFHGDFLAYPQEKKFDLIIMNNVLEHVRDPGAFLQKTHRLLQAKGLTRIQVPNDLSQSQFASLRGKEKPRFYFFHPLEHLHYFDFNSLESLLAAHGFKVRHKTTNWCMDIFNLMGIDYSNSPETGKKCHRYRVNFEYRMGHDFLLKFYEKMAELEFGRVVIEYAEKF